MRDGNWSNGAFAIEWIDADQVRITQRFGTKLREAVMDGGDFEYALQALIAAYECGKTSRERS